VQQKPTIRLAEFDWTSQQFLTTLLDRIISEKLGYTTERLKLSQPVTWVAMDKGDVDISPEIWFPGRQREIQPFLDKGTIELAGEIFGGAGNFWVVPRYVVEGDAARGIAPMAPDLKTILDLKKYWKLFENPERPGKGEIVGGEVGWVDETPWMILGYDLPLWKSNQSESIMLARMIAADKRGEPLLMVLWSPHILFSQVDLIKLENVDPDRTAEIDFDKDPYPIKTGLAEYTVYKVVRAELKTTAPDVYRLMQNISVTEDEINDLTLRVDVNGEDMTVVADDWMSKNQSRIDQWLGK
jgi:glycine betaine/proline transport system substrate-binding protein